MGRLLSDQEAVARLKAGHMAGLESLVRRYQHPARRVAFGVTQQHELAEDIVHDAFLIVYERIHQFDDTRPFRAVVLPHRCQSCAPGGDPGRT